MDKIENMDLDQLETLIARAKKKKRKMKTGKKALAAGFTICGILLVFVMAMIYMGRDTSALDILAAAAVGILPIMYGIYDTNETKINMVHMEKNYIENYDEKEGIY